MSRSIAFEPFDSPVFLRSYHQRLIHHLVRTHGSASRADLKRLSNLGFPAVGRLVDDLIKAGLIVEARQRRGGMGKPPTELAVNEARACSIGVAYHGGALRAVRVDLAGNVAQRRYQALPEPDAHTLTQAVARAVEELTVYNGAAEQPVAGVGVALLPSISEVVQDGLLADTTKTFQAPNFSRQLGHLVFVETVATAGAVGERWLGSGRFLDSFYYLSIGDDVSGTLIVHGRPYLSTRGNAGALGQAAAAQHPDAPTLSTTTARLFGQLRAAGHTPDADTLERLLNTQDERLLGWLDGTARQLAPALVATEVLLDPHAFILGGTLPSPLANALLERLVAVTGDLRRPTRPHAPEFLRGAVGDDAVAVGAATLPFYRALSPAAPTLNAGPL